MEIALKKICQVLIICEFSVLTETSPYKCNPLFAPSIQQKRGKIWGWYEHDKKR